ncbi:hypothetical protein GCM10008967_35260 [Bacillus carboniphilus]|uniref:Lipoprotein n=1 Tax=Bacillus carboniphilus TaxID=86663 RepID=A0ABP3GDV0_9BACI
MHKLRFLCLLLFFFSLFLSGCKKDEEVNGDLQPQQGEVEEKGTIEEQREENDDHPEPKQNQKDKVDKPEVIEENRVTMTINHVIQQTTHPEWDDLTQRRYLTILTSSKEAHQLLIHFMDEMNQSQVENLIQEQFPKTIQFSWSGNDLHLTIPPFEEVKPYTSQTLSIDGAQTADGVILQEQSVFTFVLHPPKQIWRFSADGSGSMEALTNFQSLFTWGYGLFDERYWLLSHPTIYCECDAVSPSLIFLFDLENQTLEYLGTFNESILTYNGDSPFWIDKRGLFLKESAVEDSDPIYQTLYKPNGYVQGALFIEDGTRIVLALGENAEDRFQDLVFIDLETMEEEVYPDVIPGFFYSELNGDHVHTPLEDEGKYLYFAVTKTEDQPEGGFYRFEKETGIAEKFESIHGFSFPKYSFDRKYKAIPLEGIFLDDQKVYDAQVWEYHWSPTQHRFVTQKFIPESITRLYEVITIGSEEKFSIELPAEYSFDKWSADGNSLFFWGH